MKALAHVPSGHETNMARKSEPLSLARLFLAALVVLSLITFLILPYKQSSLSGPVRGSGSSNGDVDVVDGLVRARLERRRLALSSALDAEIYRQIDLKRMLGSLSQRISLLNTSRSNAITDGMAAAVGRVGGGGGGQRKQNRAAAEFDFSQRSLWIVFCDDSEPVRAAWRVRVWLRQFADTGQRGLVVVVVLGETIPDDVARQRANAAAAKAVGAPDSRSAAEARDRLVFDGLSLATAIASSRGQPGYPVEFETVFVDADDPVVRPFEFMRFHGQSAIHRVLSVARVAEPLSLPVIGPEYPTDMQQINEWAGTAARHLQATGRPSAELVPVSPLVITWSQRLQRHVGVPLNGRDEVSRLISARDNLIISLPEHLPLAPLHSGCCWAANQTDLVIGSRPSQLSPDNAIEFDWNSRKLQSIYQKLGVPDDAFAGGSALGPPAGWPLILRPELALTLFDQWVHLVHELFVFGVHRDLIYDPLMDRQTFAAVLFFRRDSVRVLTPPLYSLDSVPSTVTGLANHGAAGAPAGEDTSKYFWLDSRALDLIHAVVSDVDQREQQQKVGEPKTFTGSEFDGQTPTSLTEWSFYGAEWTDRPPRPRPYPVPPTVTPVTARFLTVLNKQLAAEYGSGVDPDPSDADCWLRNSQLNQVQERVQPRHPFAALSVRPRPLQKKLSSAAVQSSVYRAHRQCQACDSADALHRRLEALTAMSALLRQLGPPGNARCPFEKGQGDEKCMGTHDWNQKMRVLSGLSERMRDIYRLIRLAASRQQQHLQNGVGSDNVSDDSRLSDLLHGTPFGGSLPALTEDQWHQVQIVGRAVARADSVAWDGAQPTTSGDGDGDGAVADPSVLLGRGRRPFSLLRRRTRSTLQDAALAHQYPVTLSWPPLHPGQTMEALPTRAAWRAAMAARLGIAAFDSRQYEREQTAQFMADLYRDQFPPDCSRAKFVYMETPKAHIPGLGTFVDEFLTALSVARATGRVLVAQTHYQRAPNGDNGGFYWASMPPACESRSYLCYFQAVSNCTEQDFGDDKPVYLPYSSADDRVIVVTGAHFFANTDNFDNCPQCGMAMMQSNAAWFDPTACPLCPNSKLWIETRYMRFLFRPQPHLVQMYERDQRSLGWPEPRNDQQTTVNNNNDNNNNEIVWPSDSSRSPLWGFHVRRTDKIKGFLRESEAHPFDAYVNAALTVQPLTDRLRPVAAFIASDDKEILREAREQQIIPNLQLLFDQNQTRIETGAVTSAHLGMAFNRTEEFVHGIKDIWLLSQTSVFVGSGSSFFTRAALRLFMSRGDWTSAVLRVRFCEADFWGRYPIGHSFYF